MPVTLYVDAKPVADRATLMDLGVLLAVLGEPTPFSFQARDLESLPLVRQVGKYAATCAEGCSATVSFTGNGNYAVHVTLSQLDEYTVSVELFGGGAKDGRLPFEKRVRAVCPAHHLRRPGSGSWFDLY
jgi:hypothetical protein